MKMPEKHDLLAAILAARQGIEAILAFAMAYLRGECYWRCVYLQKNSNRRNDVRRYRLVHSLTFSTSAGLSTNLAYITGVFIGYIGTDSIGSLIKRFAAKKAGVEDGKSIINVRRSSICWRGRRRWKPSKTRNP